MKLIEALEIIRRPLPANAARLVVGLACGFEALHLKTFLAAELKALVPDRGIEITAGNYGDFPGNLARLIDFDCDAAVVLLEWSDLDPRLGIRNLGNWGPGSYEDILENVRSSKSKFECSIEKLSKSMSVVFCAPTLPFPAISHRPSWEFDSFELEIRSAVAALSLSIAQNQNVRVVNSQHLNQLSPISERFDVDSELRTGFPFTLSHASVLAELLARLLQAPIPKKGLITDLDDTMWKGILGEVGVDGVSWDLEHHSHMHGAYQRLLQALSERGVFIAVASKNENQIVEQSLQRKDLVFSRDAIFPVEAHWRPKSESVARILKVWNVGADAVVFVDDSAIELAEVKAAFPEMECMRFPTGSNAAILDLFGKLRDLFGKSRILEEDRIRVESIRHANSGRSDESDSERRSEDFLANIEAEFMFNFEKNKFDPRALELINKTNQFKLNSERHTEASWLKYLKTPEVFLLVVSYKDKFGPLGKIAVLAGKQNGKDLFLDHWVMSCRAFSRHIEHKCLEELFERFAVEEIVLQYVPGPRNEPFRRFVSEIAGEDVTPLYRLSKERFRERHCKTLDAVQEMTNG